jgi:membrane protein
VRLLFDTIAAFQQKQGSLMAAGLAYYALISVSPLFVVGVAVIGSILGRAEARETIFARISAVFGAQAAGAVANMVMEPSVFSGGLTASLIAIAVLLYGSTRTFAALQSSLDVIWEVPPSTSIRTGIIQVIRARLIAFVMVLAIGLVMLITMTLETIGASVGRVIAEYTTFDPKLGSVGARIAAMLLRAGALFLVYLKLPSCKISWRDVWPAGLLAAILVSSGQMLIGLYVAFGGVRSAFGAAASLIVLLFGLYYTAFVVLLGGQFSKVYADRRGRSSALGAIPPA